jgi:hypothetical protein
MSSGTVRVDASNHIRIRPEALRQPAQDPK